ncbi:MAG: tRNA (adenosine(37)-N6)-dimethylallyltransferase MiaA [Moheibacter sp.]
MTEKNKYLISISGPTAIGKTGLSVFLAKSIDTEIISCDSRQFFKEMKIGTAVPTAEEMEGVPHHFIGHLSIFDDYSVGDFEKDAISKIEELFKKYDRLIMVGGSGLYEKAVIDGLDEFPEVDKKYREQLNLEFGESGIEKLQNELKTADPEYYKTADIQNPVRLIRALEIFRATGQKFSSFRIGQKTERNFKLIKIGLELPREELYERINKRVDLMMEAGLLEEAKQLYPNRNLNSLQTVGYRELFDYFDEKTDLETAVSEIKKNSRRYAKRQLTWYRKDDRIVWFRPDEKDEILRYVLKITE